MDISREHRGPFRIISDLVTSDKPQPVERGEHDHQHHQRGRRQNTPHPSGIEPRYGNAPGPRLFMHQKAGDKEARNDEKHVNTNKPPGKRSMEAVIEHHQPHSDRAHPLHISPKPIAGDPHLTTRQGSPLRKRVLAQPTTEGAL